MTPVRDSPMLGGGLLVLAAAIRAAAYALREPQPLLVELLLGAVAAAAFAQATQALWANGLRDFGRRTRHEAPVQDRRRRAVRRAGNARRGFWVFCGWWVVTAAALLWGDLPRQPVPCSLRGWLILSAAAGMACQWLTRRAASDAARRRGAIPRMLACALLGAGAIQLARHLLLSRPALGGVDFFYYLCFARDMLAGEFNSHCYGYFPGVYAFWRTAWRISGGQLAGLQAAYLILLLANAAAVGGIVVQHTRGVACAAFAALWYLVVACRYQALFGVTEPLATLPLLLGVWAWGGRPLAGPRGVVRAVALGIGLGAAVYGKQQAALLSLGAASLLVSWASARLECSPRQAAGRAARGHRFGPLVLLPLAAWGALLTGIFAEGHGWYPLLRGLRQVEAYRAENSFAFNMYVQLRTDESAAVLLAFAAALIVFRWLRWGGARFWGRPRAEVCAFLLVAACASFWQFTRRPYGHYSLLAAPAVVIVGTLVWERVGRSVRWLTPAGRPREISAALLLALALLPVLYVSADVNAPYLWRWSYPPEFRPHANWFQREDVSRDLQLLRDVAVPDQEMFVLPPRHNAPHYLLGTRCTSLRGYAFVPPATEIPWERFQAVLVIEEAALEPADIRLWPAAARAAAIRALGSHGFRPVRQLPSMTWYVREGGRRQSLRQSRRESRRAATAGREAP